MKRVDCSPSQAKITLRKNMWLCVNRMKGTLLGSHRRGPSTSILSGTLEPCQTHLGQFTCISVVISICAVRLYAMGGVARIKSGVWLLPVPTWTGLGEIVMQRLQADPPAMKSSIDFHSAHFHSSLPSPENTHDNKDNNQCWDQKVANSPTQPGKCCTNCGATNL